MIVESEERMSDLDELIKIADIHREDYDLSYGVDVGKAADEPSFHLIERFLPRQL
jgi:hypothetical protein